MRFRLRVWMPLVAVFIVLLSIAVVVLYTLPAFDTRLGQYADERNLGRAAAMADAIEEAEEEEHLQRAVDAAARTGPGQVVVVDQQGRVVARSGPRIFSAPPEEILREAAAGNRMSEQVGDRRVAVAPVVRSEDLGGIVFVPQGGESVVYQIFTRSNLEAAAVAAVLGSGLMLLVATLLGRRVEQIIRGTRSIERGNLSHRIDPGYGDELGELAGAFNSMAARLQQTSAIRDAILANLGEGVLAADLDGRLMFINSAARHMLGVGDEEPLEKLPDPWGDLNLPEAVARCARKGEFVEARVQDQNTFYRIKLERLPRLNDRSDGVLVVIWDLSDSRKLEEKQQQFVANAAHELRTPIGTIIGASELLLTAEEEGDQEDPQTRRRFLGHINSQAWRMQRLSDTLLRLARIGADFRKPDLQEMELGFAQEFVERMEPLVHGAGLKLCLEDCGERVLADPEWIEQALLILISNAVKHCERGGRIWLSAHGGTLTVEDEGWGISEEDLRHVFERHYRGGSGFGGFGLGLPICKDLVERMGGEISIDSEKGVGTVVRIELPEVRGPGG